MTVDRRYMFLLVAAAVAIPLVFPLRLPVGVTEDTRTVFKLIDDLDSGDVVMVSFDHEASALPEVRPLAEAVLTHCFTRRAKIVGLALFAEGTAAGYDVLCDIAQRQNKIYGIEYVYLGYRPQYAAAILGMGESIASVFPNDYHNAPYRDIPLLSRIHNYDDVDLVISIADGSMPTYWVEYAQARYGERVVAALTAVMVTAYAPYLDAHQLSGILGGLKGAAEYEQLLGRHGAGTRGMDAQSLAHLSIAALVVVGNVVAFAARLRKRSAAGGR